MTQRRLQNFYVPGAEWMFHVLRPIFADQLVDKDTYEAEFDRAETMLGLLAQDAANVRAANDPDGRGYVNSYWLGRATYRSAHRFENDNPVAEYGLDLSSQGASWGPLKGELFGGDKARAEKALDIYGTAFRETARRRW